jgi:hypothetical protein
MPVRWSLACGVGHRPERAIDSNERRTAAPSDGDWLLP